MEMRTKWQSARVPSRATAGPAILAPAPQAGAAPRHCLLFHSETTIGILPASGRDEVTLDKMRREKIGVEIVRRTLEESLRMIAQNAGVEGSQLLLVLGEGSQGLDRGEARV